MTKSCPSCLSELKNIKSIKRYICYNCGYSEEYADRIDLENTSQDTRSSTSGSNQKKPNLFEYSIAFFLSIFIFILGTTIYDNFNADPDNSSYLRDQYLRDQYLKYLKSEYELELRIGRENLERTRRMHEDQFSQSMEYYRKSQQLANDAVKNILGYRAPSISSQPLRLRQPIRTWQGSGRCYCPYDQVVVGGMSLAIASDHDIRYCGEASAYSRTGGQEPACFLEDYPSYRESQEAQTIEDFCRRDYQNCHIDIFN